MKTQEKLSLSPKKLSKTMRDWWDQVNENFVLEPHHLHLLKLACQAYDRSQQAKIILDKEGLSYLDKYKCPHPRPEVSIEKNARLDFARLVKQLNLDLEEPNPPGRPAGYSPSQNRRQ